MILLHLSHTLSNTFYFLRIRKQKGFTYPLFCSYVIHMVILEDFANFASSQDFNLTLSLTASSQGGSQSQTSSRRVGTRGANRGEKEEIKSAIKKQVLRNHECLDDVIIGFLKDNRDLITSCLL